MAVNSFSWGEVSGRNKVSLAIGVVAILALTLGAFYWLSQDKYNALFTDLEARDAAAVVAELERLKIDYKLAADGTSIQVPEQDVHEIRLKLMGSGVPLVGGVGFEVFDDSDFGMTEFLQRINYQRALEGELTRTVMSLKEVKYARVHLVMPEQGLFQQKDSPARASVTLFVNEAHSLGREKVIGIQRLVSAAVPGLNPAQVTVTDQEGRTLSREIAEDASITAISDRLQQKRAVEDYLVDKAMQVLNKSFGDGQAIVSVNAVLEFSQVQSTREDVLPSDSEGKGAVVRQRESRATSSERKDQGSVTTEVEYRLGRLVEQRVETPGKILQLKVGVMVPPNTPDQQRDEIRQLVEMAVGLEYDRGDAIAIFSGAPAFSAGMSDTPVLDADNQPGAVVTVPSADQLVAYGEPKVPENVKPGQEWLEQHSVQVILGVLVSVLIVLLAFVVARSKSTPERKEPRLSDAERARVLADIQTWLERDVTPPGKVL